MRIVRIDSHTFSCLMIYMLRLDISMLHEFIKQSRGTQAEVLSGLPAPSFDST